MKYKNFISKMSNYAQGFTMRQEIGDIDASLLKDLPLPEFLNDFTEMF
jgi:hypothetical protein